MSESDAAVTDVVELCVILQCLGFTVKSLDTSDGNHSQEGVARTVVVNCQSSGLHVVLQSGNLACTCPATNRENSGFWTVSGTTGGKQLEKESGSTLLGALPKVHRDRLTGELRELVRWIRDNNENESFTEKQSKETGNKSASMVELGTPEKRNLLSLKADTPTRYRSLDTLTSAKEEPDAPLPAPRLLQKQLCDANNKEGFIAMCRRQSTYTVSSTPGSLRKRNKTSSPIQPSQTNILDSLRAAEKTAEDLKNKLAFLVSEFIEESKHDSSVSSLALDVSKISVLKGETSKAQFASSPNLSGLGSIREDATKSRLKRFDSASTSNLLKPSPKTEGRLSKLKRISPNIFRTKKDSPSANADKSDGKSRLQSLFKPRIVTPVRIPKSRPEASPNMSARKKFSHIKSTIPRPTTK